MVGVVPAVPEGTGMALALPTVASGGGIILSSIGVPKNVGGVFMALMLSVFSLTTVDTSIRLGRYLVNEALAARETQLTRVFDNQSVNTSWQVIVSYLLIASGSWTTLWPLFGATVQVFAGVTMVTLGGWLARRHGALKNGMFLGAAFVLTMSIATLLYIGGTNLQRKLLNPSWIASASLLETISVGVRVLVVIFLVGITARLLWLGYNRVQCLEIRAVDITSTDD